MKKILSIISIIAGGLVLLGVAIPPIVGVILKAQTAAGSVGIIGGADGPTAVFVTVPQWTSYILPTVALIVGITGFVLLSRCKRK